MTDTSTAGWYPDPEGRPGLERWWNGIGWSESVRSGTGHGSTLTAASPQPDGISYDVSGGVDTRYPDSGYTVADPDGGYRRSGYPAGPDPWPGAGYGYPPPQGAGAGAGAGAEVGSGRRSIRISAGTWAWIGGGLVLALIISLVVNNGGGSEDPGPPIATGLAPPSGQTPPPGTTRIVDEAAGVAYPYLGTYWMEFVNEVQETTSTMGQYIITQDVTPDGGQFIAQVTSGPLRPDFGYAGPSSFANTILAVQDSVRAGYYPAPNMIETLRDEAVTVDGAQAYLLEFNLSWDVAGYDSTGERAALILIETGRPTPALMYLSIPNTHAELYGIVDRVIAEIDVLN